MLLQTLRDHGVEEIPALGLPFDPQLHEAVAHVPAEGSAAGEGYRHRDLVLRPSKVSVADRPLPAAEDRGAPGEPGSAGAAENNR
jgi:molecular chaperone GrpE